MILADEPTGALDSHSGEEVMAILKQLCAQGHTVILVTHDPAVARGGADHRDPRWRDHRGSRPAPQEMRRPSRWRWPPRHLPGGR
ncbi:hypothetical protein M8494_16590 [Serratia ureilytica]